MEAQVWVGVQGKRRSADLGVSVISGWGASSSSQREGPGALDEGLRGTVTPTGTPASKETCLFFHCHLYHIGIQWNKNVHRGHLASLPVFSKWVINVT